MKIDNRELTFYDLSIIIKKNIIKIIILSLFIVLIPAFYFYQEYNKDHYILSMEFETTPSSRLELRKINTSINELHANNLFNDLKEKLEMFYTDYILMDKNKQLLSNVTKRDREISFIDESFVKNLLMKSNYISNEKFSFRFKKNEKEYEYNFILIIDKNIKDSEISNIREIINDIAINLNKLLIHEIIEVISVAKENYLLAKKDIIESINKSNELIIESYVFDLKVRINNLKEKLELTEFLESKKKS